ncbi:MAG: AAA family ATPase [Actinomycetota bacterium]|nr:AAA family ATPase [Actinomycetota bacterium]
MRLTGLIISGFRGFPEPVTLDLDADAVIVSGVNGSGKTSMFDAILWALTGSIGRLRGEPKDVVSAYSPTGEARVELQLQRDGVPIRVVRRFDGDHHLSVTADGGETTIEAAAETTLVELLWPDAKSAPNPGEALSQSLTRATYLQQDVVRQFVEADDEQDRFRVVGELVGVGRITELQKQLESSKRSWSLATTAREKEIDPLRGEHTSLVERLRRLGTADAPMFESAALSDWVTQTEHVVPDINAVELRTQTSEAVDRALGVIAARQRRVERTVGALERVHDHLMSPPPEPAPTEPFRERVESSTEAIAQASEQLRDAQEAAATARRQQAELQDQAESLRTLAALALRHLGESCPVCSQQYDHEETRARLEAMVASSNTPPIQVPIDGVQAAAAAHEQAQRELAVDQAALRSAEQSQVAREQWRQGLAALAVDLGLDLEGDVESEVVRRLATVQDEIAQLQYLHTAGEDFSLKLARMAEQTQRSEIENQLAALRGEIAAREVEQSARTRTAELASELLVGLRTASRAIVTDELERISQPLQRIYSAVEPHPSFRAVRFLTGVARNQGQVWTALLDEVEGKEIQRPSVVLSSSQLNVLAVCTFLSLNLAIETLPLQVVALDDPLQSLDTVNLLGLADLLRRVRATRQVIISTHDERLADLLARKLRPVAGSAARTRLIRLDAWSRSGPVVDQRDIPLDPLPLKLVAAS